MYFRYWISVVSRWQSADRSEDDPIVIGGGACAYNPEPLAEFFDLFYIGEGETVYDALFDAYKANKKAGGSRRDFLLKAAQIPGIYVPLFIKLPIKKTAPSHPLRQKRQTYRKKFRKTADHRYGLKTTVQWKLRSFHILKLHRIVLLWKSSVAVSADAVSARQE